MLNYKVEGTGRPLLLIHGFGISFNIWSELRPLLVNRFFLVEVEMPGIGSSPPPRPGNNYLESAVEGIEQVRIALGIDRWQMVTYSTGTRVGERYLNVHAEQVDHAIFICPAQVNLVKARMLRLAIQLDARVPFIGTWVLSGSRLRFLIDLFGFNLKQNGRSPQWFAEISSQPVEILKETLRSVPEGGSRPFSIPECRALFIWGSMDLLITVPQITLRDRVIPAAHSAPQTDAHELSRIIVPFLLDSAAS